MRVHRSNRVEVLLELLAAILRRPLTDPMAPETLVIQSRGLQQWLSRELGEQLGKFSEIEVSARTQYKGGKTKQTHYMK